MKFIKQLFVLMVITIAFWSCSSDENVHQECYTCTNTLSEYCISEGDNFYTSSINGAASTDIPLNGEYWIDIVAQLESDCDNAPQRDCYTCNDTNTTYCFLDGDDFYTTSLNNTTPTETLLDGMSWDDIRFDLDEACADVEEDCYTCNSTTTEYCYVDGETFYTATVNGNETQTELNGESWTTVRATLENDCPTNQTASIVGDWTVTRYVAEKEVIVSGAIINTATQEIISFDNFQWHFAENPNEYSTSGSYVLHSEYYDLNGNLTFEQDDDFERDPLEIETWILNGTELQISTNVLEASGFTVQQYDTTILELTNTTLKLKYNLVYTIDFNGVQNVDEVFVDLIR